MKAKLEFDLDNFDDELAFKRACSATDAYLVLCDLVAKLRRITKYEEGVSEGTVWEFYDGKKRKLNAHECELLLSFADKVSDQLFEILEKHHIDLNNIP